MMKLYLIILSCASMCFSTCGFTDIVYTNTASTLSNDPKELYIDLIKKTVANTIYEDAAIDSRIGVQGSYSATLREGGLDWPNIAHTMIGVKRLNNVHACLKDILENNIPGDLIETGVWRGGTTILMRAILKAYNDETRHVWVADSFAGLPPPNRRKYPKDIDLSSFSILAVPLEQVQANFQKYGLLDNQVIFLRGLFKDTLPSAPIQQLALLRLDGDMYESTMDALVNLYPKLSVGGYIIIDDYWCIEACARAVHDYRALHNISEPILDIDGMGSYWQKMNDI